MSESLVVWCEQQRVGRLLLTTGRQIAFLYDGDWLVGGWPISCSLPLTETGDFIPPDMRGHHFFANLLPEGGARERLVRRLGVTDDDFLLLEKLGGDCAGALQLLPEGQSPGGLKPDQDTKAGHLLDDQLLEEAIRTGRAFWLDGDEPPRLSLAGAQDKWAIRAQRHEGAWRFYLPESGAASTHILKLPVQDLRHVPLYEAYTTFLATQLALPAAPVELVRVGGELLSLGQRFDRRTAAGGVQRLHQEDMCQAQGLSRAVKYSDSPATFPALAELLREHSVQPARDIQALANWQIFNALAGNADGHLKNLSLLAQAPGGWQLAPYYDLVSTLAIPQVSHKLALPVGGKTDPQHLHRKHWDAFAAELGVAPRLVQRLIRAQAEQLRDNADAWMDIFQCQHGELPALKHVQDIVGRQCRKALRDWL